MSDTAGPLPAHPARAASAAVGAALGRLQEANLWSLPEADLLQLRADLEVTRARLDATILATTREVDARGAATATGAATTAAWLRDRLLIHPAAAKAEVRLAGELDRDLTDTGAALARGDIDLDRAQAVAAGMAGLPAAVGPAVRRQAEAHLLEAAGRFDPAAVHRLARHLVLVVDPDNGRALERDEAAAAHRQTLSLTHHHDGSRRFRGQLGPEAGALLDAALQAVSGPRPAADGTPDPRSPGQRRAEGLLELITLAVTTEQMPDHGGEPVDPHRHPAAPSATSSTSAGSPAPSPARSAAP